MEWLGQNLEFKISWGWPMAPMNCPAVCGTCFPHPIFNCISAVNAADVLTARFKTKQSETGQPGCGDSLGRGVSLPTAPKRLHPGSLRPQTMTIGSEPEASNCFCALGMQSENKAYEPDQAWLSG